MPLVLLIVLAPAHLEDPDLLAAAVRDDGGLDRRARDDRLAEANAFAVADHQHLVENHFRAHVRRYLFYLEFFAGGNLVLLAAGFYDRVHEWNSCCWRWKPMPAALFAVKPNDASAPRGIAPLDPAAESLGL